MEEFDKIIENTNAKFMAKDDLIGRHKYNSLKIKELSGKIPLTKKEKLQIETYENKGIKPLTEDQLIIRKFQVQNLKMNIILSLKSYLIYLWLNIKNMY